MLKFSAVPSQGQVIRSGYPPTVVDMSDPSATMSSLNITSGQTLMVEGTASMDGQAPDQAMAEKPVETKVEAGIRRREVEADNHCLFYSIYFLMNEGEIKKSQAQLLRSRISQHILQNQHEFTQIVLGKAPVDYSAWIQSDNSWGGAIELSIFR